MTRWLGVDHGTKRIGIAVSDGAGSIATPVEMVPAEPESLAIKRIGELVEEYGAEGIAVGWPLNMDDSEGPQGKLARDFAGRTAMATGLDVRMWDERLTSMVADKKLAGHYTRKKRKARQDAIAAATMLQDFLSVGGPDGAPRPKDIRAS